MNDIKDKEDLAYDDLKEDLYSGINFRGQWYLDDIINLPDFAIGEMIEKNRREYHEAWWEYLGYDD